MPDGDHGHEVLEAFRGGGWARKVFLEQVSQDPALERGVRISQGRWGRGILGDHGMQGEGRLCDRQEVQAGLRARQDL